MADISFTIADKPPSRLDKAIARDIPEQALSRSALARLIVQGAVQLNGIRVYDVKAKVHAGDHVNVVVPDAEDTQIKGESIPLDVYYEDAHLIVINKPAGMVVHPAPGSMRSTLVHALLAHCGDSLSGIGGVKRPGIVHRIDKQTTGLLVAAKTDQAHQDISQQFRAHDVERTYAAVCYGVPKVADPRLVGLAGVQIEANETIKITTRLDRHRTDRKRQMVKFDSGRHAITRVQVQQVLAQGSAALIECRLETGRTHQIRVHLAYMGHGLIGDQTYGRNRKLKGTYQEAAASFTHQALHARSLGFVHPITKQHLHFSAPLPTDIKALIEKLE